MAAIVLLVYTLWFALPLLVKPSQLNYMPGIKNVTLFILLLVFVQLTYGAFMAGLKAATVAPTWPTINGEWLPAAALDKTVADGSRYTNNPFMVQFMHRTIAYLIIISIVAWFVVLRKKNSSALLRKTMSWPLILGLLQVLLGILTVVYSPSSSALLWLGVSHQFVAMLLVVSLIIVFYLLNGNKSSLDAR